MGMVGDDVFGHYLARLLREEGVDTSCLHYSGKARTMLAFVSLRAGGERDFEFYRNPSADMLHSPQDIDLGYIQSAKIFHHGSISLISEPARSATLYAIEAAEKAGLIISYDPNLRLNLWEGEEQARRGILSVWDRAHLIKVSQEEVQFLSGEPDVLPGARKLWRENNQLLIVTLGEHGCIYITPEHSGEVEGFDVQVVDTTGAGVGFVAGLLSCVLEYANTWWDESRLRYICKFANAVGALTTMRRGAIPALPKREDVQKLMIMSQAS